ncbi:MAG TPA: S1 RNA-binding domain-containing protein [Candidatus Egerieimonas intestinavium]|uniref:S1 RNA-binding domain-containing protein n=1 Tax=Candidatus Egerieimonas intestinavium TaxID=2840777 RepID=A0A9D1JGY2_9FIRM|nr:S1 RNA-binding domain-containing protein [Candidatus Egerieimonas intestinavium]
MELGKRQTLVIVKEVEFGVYLGQSPEAEKEEQVLLPARQVPAGAKQGDVLEVFLYRDSQDRLIATTASPALQVGQVALLKVKEVGRIGAFLDWGLEKDLLLPFREQTKKLHPGEEILAALYVDKSGRLCATMKLYHYLKTQSPYRPGDTVEGRIYEISDRFGVFVAVDDQYSGLIPRKEAQGEYHVGARLTLRVTGVKEDGKLDLAARKKAYLQMDEDAQLVLKVIDEFAGVLPFDDRVSPEVIQREFGLSKAAFKRAVGRLMKEGQVEIRDRRIFKK